MPKKTDKSSNSKKSNGSMSDVAKPGKAAPNTGSRPIIVTHKPMVQDPMVKDKDDKTDPEERPTLGPPEVTPDNKKLGTRGKKRLSLAPLSDEEKANAPETGSVIEPDSTTEPDDDKAKTAEIEKAEEEVKKVINSSSAEVPSASASEKIEDKSKENEPVDASEKSEPDQEEVSEESSVSDEDNDEDKDNGEDTTEKPAKDDQKKPKKEDDKKSEDTDDTGLVDELAKQAASKKQQKEEDKAAAAEKEKLDEIIAAKTYYVPIAQVTKRRVKYGLLIIVLLALAVVGLNFALDAGYIDIGVEPLTDFISD